MSQYTTSDRWSEAFAELGGPTAEEAAEERAYFDRLQSIDAWTEAEAARIAEEEGDGDLDPALFDPGSWAVEDSSGIRYWATNRETGDSWSVARIYGGRFFRVIVEEAGELVEHFIRGRQCECDLPRVNGHCPHSAAAAAVARAVEVEKVAAAIRARRAAPVAAAA